MNSTACLLPADRQRSMNLQAAIKAYPKSSAVLVRRHGVYVWGESWQKAKTMCECFDYLFEIAIKMKVNPHTHTRGVSMYTRRLISSHLISSTLHPLLRPEKEKRK